MPAKKGEPKPVFTEQEKSVLVEKICEMYESQNCSLDSACETVGISVRAFHLWRAQHADFAERFKKAKFSQQANYWESVIQPLADTALQRLLKGERAKEKKVKKEYVKMGDNETALTVTEQVVTKKEILPNAAVTIFVNKGLHPERFVDQVKTDTTVKVQDDSWFAQLPFESQLEILRIKNAAKNAESPTRTEST